MERDHQIVQEIKEELQREVENLRQEITQVRSLVQDAILKLTDSFNGLRDESNQQHRLVSSIISASSDDENVDNDDRPKINIRQFVSETDQILRSFVDHILLVSRQSMEMVHRIDDLSNQMKEVVSFLKDINAIAEQTNVLALNARIVAARAGEAGSAFAVVADEVRKLSRNSNQFSNQINEVVKGSQKEIQEAKKIIEVMASKDMSFAIESKGRVDEMMTDVAEIDRFTATTLQKVSAITDEINHRVGLAVMSLQFEDMVTQVTQNMDRKFSMLEEFVSKLCCGCLDEGQDSDTRLQAVREILEQQRQQFDDMDSKAVGQVSLDEGDIELF
ncbi:methyl-accepting chemotaxis protein [Magnetococcales bacterium HHB-1]